MQKVDIIFLEKSREFLRSHARENPGETTNVYSKHPEIVANLKALLKEARTSGRTAPKR